MDENQLIEQVPAEIPTKEEVEKLMKQFLGERQFVIQSERYDDNGLYMLELHTEGRKPGEIAEYAYIRRNDQEGVASEDTMIYLVYYQGDMPSSDGGQLAKMIDGKWKIFETSN